MRHTLNLILSLVVAAGLIVGAWLFQDRWLMRSSAAAADRLWALGETMSHAMPDSFGEWEGQESDELAQAVVPVGVTGHTCYAYKHKWTNRSVLVYVVWGPSRVIVGHTPADWYPKCGFRLDAGPSPLTVVLDESRAELSTAVFVKEESTAARRLRVSWTTSDDGPWVSSCLSLTTLGGSRPVIKVYLVSDAPTAEGDEADSTIEFARGFLSALTHALAPAPPTF